MTQPRTISLSRSPALRRSAPAWLLLGLLLAALARPADAAYGINCSGVQPPDGFDYRVLVVGDSWAYGTMTGLNAEFAKTPGLENVRATGHAWWQCTTLLAGTTAAQWNTDEYRIRIADALKAYPAIDVVHIILGFNDVKPFGGQPPWDSVYRENAARFLRMSYAERSAIFSGVAGNLKALSEFILAQKPGMRVVIASYDYTNQVDPPEEFRSDIEGVVAGPLPATNPWFWQGLSNWQLTELERVKRNLVFANPAIRYQSGLGLLQFKLGYALNEEDFDFNDFTYPEGLTPYAGDKSVPVGVAPGPWYGGFSFLPTPASAMMDRFHLNYAAYQMHGWWGVNSIYKKLLAPAP